jgi:hypothetical protein
MNRWLPYDRRRGAAAYISKYVVKELGDITWSDNLALEQTSKEAGTAPSLKQSLRVENPPLPLRMDDLPNEIRWLELASRTGQEGPGRTSELSLLQPTRKTSRAVQIGIEPSRSR